MSPQKPHPFSAAALALALSATALALVANAAGSTAGKATPTNLAPPTISGSAQVGSTLTAAPGSWNQTGLRYAYQWLRCDSGGTNCLAIGGATATSYRAASGDTGAALRISVKATSKYSSTSATSNATAVVVSSPAPATAPSNTSAPSISGSAQQGQTLSAAPGSWNGTAPIGFAYQWQRCDSGGGSCAAIANASSTAYVLTAADAGLKVRASVTASNSAGGALASSATTAVVAATPPPATAPSNTSAPSISGSAQQGQTLSAAPGSWNGTAPIGFAYQWQRCDSAASSCAPIAGASNTAYVLTLADAGSRIRTSVTASNSAGGALASSAATAVVTATPPASSSVSGAWFAATSAFNTPIPANVAVRPNNSSLISAMQNVYCPGSGCVAPGDYFSTPSVWVATNSTPLVTVEINYPSVCRQSTVQVPIPAGAVVSHAGDPEPVMAIVQGDTGEEWDFYKVTAPGVTPVNSTGPQNCPADSNWQAVMVAHHGPGWTGSGSESSTRASGTLSGAGLIRPRDWKLPVGSTWDHALAFAYPGTLGNAHVWPAVSNDGVPCVDTNTCIPEGARFQLDSSVDCATWPSLTSEFVRQMCRTLQKYGMIVVDSGGGLIAENSVSGQSTHPSSDSLHDGQTAPWNVYPYVQNLPQDLVAKLRVIDWTKWQ